MPPYTYSFTGTLPDGLTLTGTTITGTPTTVGNPQVTLKVTDHASNFASSAQTINVVNAAPQGSCQPSSSLSVLVSGSNVTSYVPKGNWSVTPATGISVVNIEGSAITPTPISTTNTVNSCASNSVTGQTVCTANNTDVYLITGTTLGGTLTSGGTSTIGFSGGSCTNCGVAMD